MNIHSGEKMNIHFLEVDKQGKIYIPSSIASKLGLGPNDKVIVIVYDDHLELGPIDMDVIRKAVKWHTPIKAEKPKVQEKVEKPRESFPKPFKPITEEQIHTILDLCRELDTEPPHDLESLSYETAEALIKEYRSRLESVSEAKEYLGMEKGEKPASMEQKRYVKYLSKKAGIPISDEELGKMTSKEASRRIKELKEKLGMK